MLCDDLEAWDGLEGGGTFKKEAIYVYLWLIHIVVQQKPTEHCKAIIFQSKINLKRKLKNYKIFNVYKSYWYIY